MSEKEMNIAKRENATLDKSESGGEEVHNLAVQAAGNGAHPVSTDTKAVYYNLMNAAPGASKIPKPVVQGTNKLLASQQPRESYAATTLAMHGIKVRDFAYESTLPPIPPVRRPPREIIVGPRPLKRARKDYDEDDEPLIWNHSPFTIGGMTGQGRESESKKTKPLERTPTEPAIDNTSFKPRREPAFIDIAQVSSAPSWLRKHGEHGASTMRSEKTLPCMPDVQLPTSQDFSYSQPPPLQSSSQDSEPYVDTPIVTPNGSLQFPLVDTSDIPTSQLDTDSQAPVPDDVTYSQLGFTPPHSQIDNPLLEPLSSPLSVPPIRSSDIPPDNIPESSSPPPARHMRHLRSSAVDSLPSPPVTSDPIAEKEQEHSPRYFLRERAPPAHASPPRSRQLGRGLPARASGVAARSRTRKGTSKEPSRARSSRKTDARGVEDKMVVR